jgi:hypothetical protein
LSDLRPKTEAGSPSPQMSSQQGPNLAKPH